MNEISFNDLYGKKLYFCRAVPNGVKLLLKPSDSHSSGGFNVVQFNSVVQMLCKKKALTLFFNELRLYCVPRTGVEPAHLSIYAPETYASTNSAIGARNQCPGQESNLHAVIGTTPSKWRVYQFHHLGLKSAAKIQLFSMLRPF